MPDPYIEQFQELNDKFRTTFTGGAVITSERFNALEDELKSDILWRIRNFDAFDAQNDPHGEHSYVAFDYRGYTVTAQIDHWSKDMTSYSYAPLNPDVTQLVMQIDAEPL